MKPIAVCIDSYNIDYSPSIINLLDYLSDHFQVHLYLRNVLYSKSKVLDKSTIITTFVRNPFTFSLLLKSAKRVLKDLIKTVLPGRKPGLLTRSPSVSPGKIRKQAAALEYYRYICIDPQGFLLCKELFPDSHPIYYSLELYLKDDYLDSYYSPRVMRSLQDLMERERSRIADIRGLIIQSEEKAGLFITDYQLPPNLPTFILPVTYTGEAVTRKSRFLAETYGIDEKKKIALHLGGMNDWFSCIQIAEVFARMPGWILFFQGNHNKSYLKRFQQAMARIDARNIIVSRTFYHQLDRVDQVLMSAQLGIAWYNDISKNFTTAGKSSGKISAYMRFGLPIVAKKYPSTVAAIEETRCGFCVDDFDQIENVVKGIEENFDMYSRNAHREYEKTYWFEKYKEPLLTFIRNIDK